MVTLSAYLKENNVTVEAFAASIGVSRMSVYRYLNGDNRPRWQILKRISDVTGGKVTPDSFMAAPDESPEKRVCCMSH